MTKPPTANKIIKPEPKNITDVIHHLVASINERCPQSDYVFGYKTYENGSYHIHLTRRNQLHHYIDRIYPEKRDELPNQLCEFITSSVNSDDSLGLQPFNEFISDPEKVLHLERVLGT